MAERRMFAKTIIDSDAFLDMPMSSQCLYFHLAMRADDEGFLNNPKKIQRMVGASDDDLKLLLTKRFILAFDTGVIVIKHWKIHNYIRNDRFKPTVYEEEKAQLTTKDNGAYTFGIPDDNRLVYQMDTQVRIGEDRVGQDREGKDTHKRSKPVVIVEQDEDDDGFSKFWEAYPCKAGDIRQAYFEYLGVLKTGVDPQTLLDAVKWQAEEKETRYMGSAEKWLRNKGWTEKKSKPKSNKSYTTAAEYEPPQPVSMADYDFLDKI